MFASLQTAYAELTDTQFELEHRAAELNEARELFEQVIDSMSEALFLLDVTGRVLRTNAAAAAMLERSVGEVVGEPLDALWQDPGVPTTPWQLAAQTSQAVLADVDVVLHGASGRTVLGSASCGLVRDKFGKVTSLLVVVRDITERKRAEVALGLFARLSTALSQSLDGAATVARVAEAPVPTFADCCVIYRVDADEAVRRAASAAADASALALLEEVDEEAFAVEQVIASGRSRMGDGPSSWISVPLTARGRTFGAMCVIATGSRPAYGPPDVEIAEELARRAALAIDNARLYEVERDVAETLQRSLLPQRMPDLPGIGIAARYSPARPMPVGGDWYDVFELAHGAVGLVMGDVAGRGVAAAAIMGRLRNALRAYALDGHPPAAVVRRLNRLMENGEMATLLYAVFDPVTSVIRFVRAGHPPLLVVAPDGTVAYLEGGSPVLGIHGFGDYAEHEAVIEPGSTLLLYTDGLVELRDRHIDERLDRLAQCAAEGQARDLEGMLAHLLEAMLPASAAADDVALLAIRPSPLDVGELRLRMSTDSTTPRRLRTALGRWLDANGAAPGEGPEIVLACSEAVANAIEHAYGPDGGVVELVARRAHDDVAITVKDRGRWRPPRPSDHGRGRLLMESLMDEVTTDAGRDGTTVTMRRRIGRRT